MRVLFTHWKTFVTYIWAFFQLSLLQINSLEIAFLWNFESNLVHCIKSLSFEALKSSGKHHWLVTFRGCHLLGSQGQRPQYGNNHTLNFSWIHDVNCYPSIRHVRQVRTCRSRSSVGGRRCKACCYWASTINEPEHFSPIIDCPSRHDPMHEGEAVSTDGSVHGQQLASEPITLDRGGRGPRAWRSTKASYALCWSTCQRGSMAMDVADRLTFKQSMCCHNDPSSSSSLHD